MDTTTVVPNPSVVYVTQPFPTAAIICLSIGAYVIVVVIVLCIRSCLQQRGICGEGCCGSTCCGREGEPQCSECCIVISESFNCCGSPNFDACIDAICPARRKLDCADIIMCQCCIDDQCCDCCYNQEPLCDCGDCSCTCNCQVPKCENINCCCFQLNQPSRQPCDMPPDASAPRPLPSAW